MLRRVLRTTLHRHHTARRWCLYGLGERSNNSRFGRSSIFQKRRRDRDRDGSRAFAWRFAFPDAARAERPTLVLIVALVLAGAVITRQFAARRREQHLRSDVEARLETEQEMSRAKDRFLAEISSELRTPLMSIHTFSEYLLDHGLQSANETREVVGMINRDSSSLSHTIEDLLVAARLATSTLQVETAPVDLVAIATEEAHRFRRDDTSIQVHGEPTYGWADRTLVRHVIRNLVTNAIRHGEGKIDIVVATAGSASSVTVSDNGTGFADCPALAVQTDASGGRRSDSLLTSSTRLGLDVARSLTEAMGGTCDTSASSGGPSSSSCSPRRHPTCSPRYWPHVGRRTSPFPQP